MIAISQNSFSSAFLMKMYEFKTSMKFVSKGPINNIPALVHTVGIAQATSHCMNQRPLAYRRICVSRGLNEFI